MSQEVTGGTAPQVEAQASTADAPEESVATAVVDEPAAEQQMPAGSDSPAPEQRAADVATSEPSADEATTEATAQESAAAASEPEAATAAASEPEPEAAPAEVAEVAPAEVAEVAPPGDVVSAVDAGAGESVTAPAVADAPAAAPSDGEAALATAAGSAVPSGGETEPSGAAVEAPPAPSVAEFAAAPRAAESAVAQAEPTTMEELLQQQAAEIRSFKHGDVVEGTVVRVDRDEILVDIGAKSEGVVSNREIYGRHAESQPQPKVGDTVLVYVLQPESNEGHAVLSLRRAGLERKWRAMQEQLDAGAIIEAPVIDHNKGGLIVDCGIRGFVPISQIVDFPRRPQNEQPRDAAQEIAEKLQPYVGRKLRLKILEVNRKANRLILSEKVALYEERREKRDELFSNLQVGQRVSGTVRSIAPFGIFVDLGGIDGLVHKSELSWNKVNNPEAGYRVSDKVEAEVIDINHERGRISLSVRRLQPDPWNSTVADFKVGDVIDGTVTKIVNFGAFVRVRDGLEGLIHISELSHQRVAHPSDVVHEGQTLKLKIISLDSERHRLGLSLKQAEEAPVRVAPEPRERRPRPERGYDLSQAIQEPEGGIDNTLAAAFAQVRQQMAAAEAASAPADEAAPAPAEAAATSAEEASAPAEEAAPAPAEAASALAEAAAPAEEASASAEASSAEASSAEASSAEASAEASAAAPADEPAADTPEESVERPTQAVVSAPGVSGERADADSEPVEDSVQTPDESGKSGA